MARRTFLREQQRVVFEWFRQRFPWFPWAERTRKATLTIMRQMPRSHAEKYELKTIWYWYPLYCLGGMAIIAFIVLTITGVVLGFYYVPNGAVSFTPEGNPTSPTFESMQIIINEVPLGYIWRGIHHWAAHIMIAAVFLHMVRVYFTGAYKNPRELNWIIGVILLLLTLAFGYTGYLLPWNDLAQAAGTIGINMSKAMPGGDIVANLVFGGTQLGSATVLRMYWLHVFILPLVTIGLISVHVLLVWIQGVGEPH